MTATPPDIPVIPARRSLWDRMSVVWLVPVAALVVALGIAWQNWANQGPLIAITLADASGITPRETQLRFRDVGVGLVEELEFTPEFDRVIVHVRLDPAVADYVDDDATFWVVRPQVSAQGITGLDTVLSGVYLKGQWDTSADGLRRSFEGLAEAPLLSADEQGTAILLRATEGGLSGNVPVLYKGVEVGRVGPAEVTLDGFAVEAEAVILAPWDALLTDATRFYNVSGFSLSFGPSGASVNFESAASLLVGGISFETWVAGAPLADEGDTFTVYSDSDTARSSVFNRADGPPLYLSAIFEGNVTGLALGALVEIDGLRIGEVTGLTGIVDRDAFGDGQVRLLTQLAIQPARLGLTGDGAPQETLALLQEQVGQGLRAQLVTGSILNGALKVQLTDFPEIPAGAIDLDAVPYPALPVAASSIADIQATAQSTLDRISSLPVEDLLTTATAFLENANNLVGSADVQATPGDIRRVIASVEALTASDEVQAVPAQVSATLAELEATLAEARALVTDLNAQGAGERVLAAVDAVTVAAGDVELALADVPGAVTNFDGLVSDLRALPLAQIGDQATAVLAAAEAFIASDGVQALPGRVSGAVDGVAALVEEVRAEGIVANVGAAVTDLRAALAEVPGLVDQVAAAVTAVQDATAGLPALVENANAVAANLAQADVDAILTAARDLIAQVAGFVGSDPVQALPANANALMAEVTVMATDLNDGGAATNLAAALQSIQTAAAEVAASTGSLPDLVAEANRVLANANTALAGLSDLGQTMRDVRGALREISRAADAVASLATRLERNPNSLIFGN